MSWFLKLAFVLGIFAVCAVSTASVQMTDSELARTEEKEEELLLKVLTVIQKAQELKDKESDPVDLPEKRAPTGNGECSVTGNAAECCGDFTVSFIDLDGCVRGEYLPDKMGVHVTVTFNGKELIDGEVSAVNPPPLCAKIPYVRFASVCVKMSNVQIGQNGEFSACFSASAELFVSLGSIDIGCFSLN